MSVVLPIYQDPRFRISTATGGETVYSVPFPFQDNDDIAVVKYSTAGVETTLGEGAQYTLTGAKNPSGGSIVLTTPMAAGEKILRVGRAVLDRVTSVVRNGKFASEAIDSDLDRWILIAQELARDVARSFKAPFGALGGTIYRGAEHQMLAFDSVGNLRPVNPLSITYRGPWNGIAAYAFNDIVEYGGSLWIARVAHSGAVPMQGGYWNLFLTGGITADGAVARPKLAPSLSGQVPVATSEHNAVGNLLADDTDEVAAAVSAAASAGRKVYLSGNHLVTAFSNVSGVEFTGPGKVLTAEGGGYRLETPQGLDDQIVVNRQLASVLINRIMTGTWNKVIFSGPSTTYGDGLNDPNNTLSNLIGLMTRSAGLRFVSTVNAGHGGHNVQNWLDTHLATDMGNIPTCYVLGWGPNDPIFQVSGFIARLDTGLTTFRATYGVEDCAVIICSPPTMGDLPSARDERWCENINAPLRALAKKHDAVFVDLYKLAQQSRRSNGVWMADDVDPGNLSRVIHPLDPLNMHFAELLFEVMFPAKAMVRYRDNAFYNMHSAEGGGTSWQVTALPDDVLFGINMYRTAPSFTANGKTFDGSVINVKHADEVCYQDVFEFGANPRGARRYAIIGSNSWGPFHTIGAYDADLAPTSPTFALDPTNKGRVSQSGSEVSIHGVLTQSSATVGVGATVAIAPAGFRPKAGQTASIVIHTSAGESKQGRVFDDGNVKSVFALSACTSLEFTGSWSIGA